MLLFCELERKRGKDATTITTSTKIRRVELVLIHGRKGEKESRKREEKKNRIWVPLVQAEKKRRFLFPLPHTHTDIYLSILSNVRKCIKSQKKKKTEKKTILRVKAITSFSL